MSSERLTDTEAARLVRFGGITTITFFKGDAQAAAKTLKTRFAAVVKENPWLAGILVKVKPRGLDLQFPDKFHGGLDALFHDDPEVPINSKMHYSDLRKTLVGTKAIVPTSVKLIGNGKPLVALSVIPDSLRPQDTFAVVFSCSHAIMDGFTYYQLLAMISSEGTPSPMSPTRKHSIETQKKTAVGEEEWRFSTSRGVKCNYLTSMLFGSKPLIESYYLSADRVAKSKAEAVKMGREQFVSTNDIMTSAFARATNARVLYMAINCRERLPDFTASDAGNYEAPLVFGPEEYDAPELIRKTLKTGPPRYLRGGSATPTPLPGFCAACCCSTMALITNWAFASFDELRIDGCTHMLHMPIRGKALIPMDTCIVYKPRAGELAALFLVRSADADGMNRECPLGERITSPEEAHAARAID